MGTSVINNSRLNSESNHENIKAISNSHNGNAKANSNSLNYNFKVNSKSLNDNVKANSNSLNVKAIMTRIMTMSRRIRTRIMPFFSQKSWSIRTKQDQLNDGLEYIMELGRELNAIKQRKDRIRTLEHKMTSVMDSLKRIEENLGIFNGDK